MNFVRNVWGHVKGEDKPTTEKTGDGPQSKIVLPPQNEPTTTVHSDNSIDNEMTQLEKEIDDIKNIIKDMDEVRQKLKDAYNKSLTSVSASGEHKNVQVVQLELKNMGIKIKAAKKALEKMNNKTKKMTAQQGLSAIVRIRETQYAELLREFLNRKTKFEAMKQKYEENSKNRVERGLRIINPDITDEMVQNIIEKQELTTEDLFQKQLKLTASQKHTLDAHLSEAMDTHREILELQRSFMELHAMFQDFATILEEQEPMLDVIDQNITRANSEIVKGTQNMRDAKSYLITSQIRKVLPF